MQSLLQLSFSTRGFTSGCCCPGDLGKWQHMLASKSSVSQSHAGKEDEVCPQKPSATCDSPASSSAETEPRNMLMMSWKQSQQAICISFENQKVKLLGKAAKRWALKGFLGKLWRTFSLLPYRCYCHLLWLCSRSVTSVTWEHCIKKIVSSILQSMPSICAVKLPKACFF